MQPDQFPSPRHRAHQERCQEIVKRAYYERLTEHALGLDRLEKSAAEFRVDRGLLGGSIGANLGAAGALAANQYGGVENPWALGGMVAAPAMLGGAIGGFTEPSEDELAYRLYEEQMENAMKQQLGEMKAQMSNADSVGGGDMGGGY